MDDNQELIHNFKQMINRAMHDAKYAHELIFDEKKTSIAIAYLNSSIAKFSASEALCYAHFDDLYRIEIENFFHQFHVFSDEMLTNIRTDHSHQWSAIEYDRLIELYEDTPLHD